MIYPYVNTGSEWAPPAGNKGIEAEGEHYKVLVSDDLTVEGAVDCLKETMEILADHSNVDPMAFQGALMSAMMQVGKD